LQPALQIIEREEAYLKRIAVVDQRKSLVFTSVPLKQLAA
jgi:hypothetical protein